MISVSLGFRDYEMMTWWGYKVFWIYFAQPLQIVDRGFCSGDSSCLIGV